jgi:hypothetical protein
VVSDSRCRGVNPAQLASCAGPGKRPTSPISPGEHRGQDRSDTRDGLYRDVAGIGAQPAGDQPSEEVDLEVDNVDEPQARVHLRPHRWRQPNPLQQLSAVGAEQIRHRDRYSGAGEHRVHLAFQVRSQPDQFGPVAHQLPQLPTHWWGDPRLG